MAIDFNLWFIELAGHSGTTTSTTSVWQEQVDGVYYAKNTVLSPAAATSRVRSLRTTGATHQDDPATGPACRATPAPVLQAQ